MEIRTNQWAQSGLDLANQTKQADTNTSLQENKNNTETKAKEEKEIKKAVDKLNKFLEGDNAHAIYEVHEKFKSDIMIKIVDDKTNEVLMEIPPKKILDMIAKMCELVGVVFDKKV